MKTAKHIHSCLLFELADQLVLQGTRLANEPTLLIYGLG